VNNGRRRAKVNPTQCVAMLLFLLPPMIGCNSRIGPTAGMVKFEDGSPVQAGKIEFRSIANGSRYSSRIDLEGRFQPSDPDRRLGLPSGVYEVVVVQLVLTEDLKAEDHQHGQTVPRRYADYYTSGLQVEVAEDQTSDIEVILASE